MRAQQGLPNAFDSGIAAAELGAPPERMWRTEVGCARRIGPRALEDTGHHDQVGA
jgi:hypothetical protein